MSVNFYDSFGLDGSVFRALYHFHGSFVNVLWKVLSYGYGYWMAALTGLVLSLLYLKNRAVAVPGRADMLAEMMATLILGFSLVWCVVYTVQTITLWPRPWMLYPDTVTASAGLYWHEGFPASAPAIAMLISTLCWPYTSRLMKMALTVYVAVGTVLPVISGQSWPADVVCGLLVGYAGARLAKAYYHFGVRLLAP